MSEPSLRNATVQVGHATIRGEVDLSTVPAVTATVMAAIDDSPDRVTVDLSQVTFFGVCGVSSLLKAKEAARNRGTGFLLSGCSAAVLRTLEATGARGEFVLANDR